MKYEFKDKGRMHLHTLDGKPLLGTSTICGMIGKGDALSWWAAGLAVGKLGWRHPGKHSAEAVKQAVAESLEAIRAMTPDAYEKLLSDAYKAHNDYKNEAAKRGTDMHARLEAYVKACLERGGAPFVRQEQDDITPFETWAINNVEKFLWSEMHCYSERLWVGGISDAGAVLKDGKTAIIDFKSSKEAYFSQFVQVAAYDIQIKETGGFDAKGTQMFPAGTVFEAYVVVPFGAETFEPKVVYATEEYRTNFEHLVPIYKSKNNYENV